jgi:hypothetical protein
MHCRTQHIVRMRTHCRLCVVICWLPIRMHRSCSEVFPYRGCENTRNRPAHWRCHTKSCLLVLLLNIRGSFIHIACSDHRSGHCGVVYPTYAHAKPQLNDSPIALALDRDHVLIDAQLKVLRCDIASKINEKRNSPIRVHQHGASSPVRPHLHFALVDRRSKMQEIEVNFMEVRIAWELYTMLRSSAASS